MRTNIILLCFSVLSLVTSCKSIQERKAKTKDLVSNLSWKSFTIDVTYGTQLILDETANKLENQGKKSSKNLLKALNDSNKTVVAHMILTKIWEPEVFFLTTPICSEMSDDDYSLYILNNLIWYKPNNSSVWFLDEKNKKIIIDYWEARLKQMKSYEFH